MDRPLHLTIDPQVCRGCPRCHAAQVCRLRAIVQIDPGETPYLEAGRCRDCRVCLPACPYGAVRADPPRD